MKSVKYTIILIILLVWHFATSEAWIKFQEVKNANNVTEFSIIEGHTIEVPNRHNGKTPSLKLSLKAAAIDGVDKINSTAWKLKLSEKSDIEISAVETGQNVTEYNIVWRGVVHHVDHELCFHYQHNSASWYHGYQSTNTHWPMDVKHKMDKVQFNHMFEFERYSAPSYLPREFEFILEHLLLNSDGFAVHLDQHQPLFIRRDPNKNDAVVCFSVNNDGYYYLRKFHNETDLELKVRLFASTNIRSVSDYVVHQSKYITKPTGIPKDLNLFRYPSWFSEVITDKEFNQDKIIAFGNNLSTHGLSPKHEFVVEHYKWIDYIEGYTINTKMFPHLDTLATTLLGKGVQLGAMLVSPRLAKASHHADFDKYVLRDHWKNPLWFIDLSLPEAAKFYSTVIGKLNKDYKMNTLWLKSFIFDRSAEFNDTAFNKYSSLYATKYIETVSKASDAAVIAEFAYKSQHLPVFYRLIDYYTTPPQQLLQELIPTVLSVSIAGYSFIIPFSIGAFDTRPKGIAPHLITEEIYIRMLQATTFMPSMSFTKVPWSFNQKVVDLTKKYVNLHTEHSDTIIELARKRVKDGTPIIRPMWYASPDEAKTFKIGDQFMLGENIVVAPVVVEGQRERNVYLPPGNWVDQHGKTFKGPGDFKVLAPLEELPYFKKSEH